MTLAATQRGLRDLLRDGVARKSSEYLDAVAGSERLTLQRELLVWWRMVGIERSCPLVATLLKRRGRFDDTVSAFVAEYRISPYVEQLAEAFVAYLRADADPLVATLAQFEHALRRVRAGEQHEFVVAWPVEPYATMASLLRGEPLAEEAVGGSFVTVMSAAIPGHFRVERADG